MKLSINGFGNASIPTEGRTQKTSSYTCILNMHEEGANEAITRITED
jgi:hypothetical protein